MEKIVLIITVFIGIYLIITYNGLIYSKKRIERSKALIDVYLKKRFDLIPNLVECVKAYSKYEKETLKEITKLRKSFAKDANKKDGSKLNEYYKEMIVLLEKYPELRAGENFLHLQKELSKVESEISASRRVYSNDITNYNTKVESFPTNIIAMALSYKVYAPPSFVVDEIDINF